MYINYTSGQASWPAVFGLPKRYSMAFLWTFVLFCFVWTFSNLLVFCLFVCFYVRLVVFLVLFCFFFKEESKLGWVGRWGRSGRNWERGKT